MALALGEPGAREIERRLATFTDRSASNLVESEVRSALAREGLKLREDVLELVRWILPTRPLSDELAAVLAAGYVRGADLWHLACAVYASEGYVAESTFLTLDQRQRAVAAKLGFRT